MGFDVPIKSLLRDPLRYWAASLLSKSRLWQGGYLNPSPIQQKPAEYLSGKHNWHYPLGDVLMLQAWMAEQ